MWWAILVCLLIALVINGEIFSPSLQYFSFDEANIRPNHMGAFSVIRCDPDLNTKPSFAMSFDSLSTENGKVSFFYTALQRTMKINDFKVSLFRYSSKFNKSDQDKDRSATLKDMFGQDFKYFLSKAGLFSNEETDFSIDFGVDFKNISKLLVNNFHFNRFLDEELKLSIKSKKAETCFDQSGLVLRGHVVIKANSDSELECNHIVWNINSEMLEVKGTYFLKQRGIFKTGKDICLDMNLNELHISKSTQNIQKEKIECFTKLH